MLSLNDKTLLEPRAFINGKWVENGKTFPVLNPATGEKITDVTDVSADEANRAIDQAYEAQKDWAAWTAKSGELYCVAGMI